MFIVYHGPYVRILRTSHMPALHRAVVAILLCWWCCCCASLLLLPPLLLYGVMPHKKFPIPILNLSIRIRSVIAFLSIRFVWFLNQGRFTLADLGKHDVDPKRKQKRSNRMTCKGKKRLLSISSFNWRFPSSCTREQHYVYTGNINASIGSYCSKRQL